MIEKALKYIIDLSNPFIKEIGNGTYSDKQLHRISCIDRASSIEMNTLSSLIDYIKSGVDSFAEQMIIHVQSPTKVKMYSALDWEREREYVVEVNAQLPRFVFDNYQDHESFCISLQAKCIDDPETDKALLLKFAGTVEAGSVAEYGDDGISQKATIKTGIASKGECIVPSPAKLRPYRTFVEVEQPMSEFIFRMKEDKYTKSIQCALFEADGGAWKIAAMDSIRTYLVSALAGYDKFVVIC